MSDRPETPLLDTVQLPADIRALDKAQLPQLADELRAEMISAVSQSGGHLGSGLGVVELTVAVHYVFDTPADRLIWDVGHQAYPHKILTGRRDRIRTLRTAGGLSGFTKRTESDYDPFGAAHSSTSISAGLGMAVARRVEGVVDRGGQFHDAEASAEVATGHRNGVNGFLAEFVRDLTHLLDLEFAQIVGRTDRIEKRRFAKCGHSDIQFCMSGRTARRETGSALTAPRKSRLRCHPGGPVPDLKA